MQISIILPFSIYIISIREIQSTKKKLFLMPKCMTYNFGNVNFILIFKFLVIDHDRKCLHAFMKLCRVKKLIFSFVMIV